MTETMDDLIDRVIYIFCRDQCGCNPEECSMTYERNGAEECSAVRFLKEIPYMLPVKKRGKWIKIENTCYSPFDPCSHEFYYVCNQCGRKSGQTDDYCKNCGAKMGGGVNDA